MIMNHEIWFSESQSYTMLKYVLCSMFNLPPFTYRVLKGGCPRGGGNWGTLRIPREDWGTLGNIREY